MQEIYRKFLSSRVLTSIFSSSIALKMTGGFLWLLAGIVPVRVASLIATVIVVRILGTSSYGEFCLARSTTGTFLVIATFGMGRASAKYIAEYLTRDLERVGNIVAANYLFTFITSGIVAFAFFWFAPFLCENVFEIPHLVNETRFCVILLITTTFVGVQSGVLAGFQAFRETSIAGAISGALSIPFFVLGAKYGGTLGALIGFSTNSFINALINNIYISKLLKSRNVPFKFWNCWKERGVLWNFCLPSTLFSLCTSCVTWGISVLIVRQPNGSGELGILDAMRQIQTSILYLPVLAMNVVVPVLSEINGRRDRTLFVKTARGVVIINLLFTLVVSIIAAIFSSWIINAFGRGFEQAFWTLYVVLITCVVMSVTNVYGSILTSLGALWIRFVLATLGGILSLIILCFCRNGLPASLNAAIAILSANILQCVGYVIFANRAVALRLKTDDDPLST